MHDDPDDERHSWANDVATFLCLIMLALILAAAIFLMFSNVSITVDAGGECPVAGK